MNESVNPAHLATAPASSSATAASLDHYWMPFTANRYFKAHPKLVSKAEGSYLTLTDGRKVFDCLSGLWCSPLGHAHPKVVETVKRQAETVDFCAPFQVANPLANGETITLFNLNPTKQGLVRQAGLDPVHQFGDGRGLIPRRRIGRFESKGYCL